MREFAHDPEFQDYLRLTGRLYIDAVRTVSLPPSTFAGLGGVFKLAAADARHLRKVEDFESTAERMQMIEERASIRWERSYQPYIERYYFQLLGDWEYAFAYFYEVFDTVGHTLDELIDFDRLVIGLQGKQYRSWMHEPLQRQAMEAQSKVMTSVNGLPASLYLIASGNITDPSPEALQTAITIANSGIMDALEGVTNALSARTTGQAQRAPYFDVVNRSVAAQSKPRSRATRRDTLTQQRGTRPTPKAPTAMPAPGRPARPTRARKRLRSTRSNDRYPTSAAQPPSPQAQGRGNTRITEHAAWESVKPLLSVAESTAAQRFIGQFPSLPRAIWRHLISTLRKRMLSQLAQHSTSDSLRAHTLAAEHFDTAVRAFWFHARHDQNMVKWLGEAGLTFLPALSPDNPIVGPKLANIGHLVDSTKNLTLPPVWRLPDGTRPAMQVVHRDTPSDPTTYLDVDSLMFTVVPSIDMRSLQRFINPLASQLQTDDETPITTPAAP